MTYPDGGTVASGECGEAEPLWHRPSGVTRPTVDHSSTDTCTKYFVQYEYGILSKSIHDSGFVVFVRSSDTPNLHMIYPYILYVVQKTTSKVAWPGGSSSIAFGFLFSAPESQGYTIGTSRRQVWLLSTVSKPDPNLMLWCRLETVDCSRSLSVERTEWNTK